jgi:hypothetical protein
MLHRLPTSRPSSDVEWDTNKVLGISSWCLDGVLTIFAKSNNSQTKTTTNVFHTQIIRVVERVYRTKHFPPFLRDTNTVRIPDFLSSTRRVQHALFVELPT